MLSNLINLMQSVKTILLSILFLTSLNSVIASDDFSEYVNTNGEITFPNNFKLNFVHIGSWFAPEGEASGFHDVYTEKESVVFYQENGEFPDGATLVKELRASDSGEYTTGKEVHHSNSKIKQWFVMVKDHKGRFTENRLWGSGWGWALYLANEPTKNVATDYAKDCLGCHVPAQKTDLIYIEGYPILTEHN